MFSVSPFYLLTFYYLTNCLCFLVQAALALVNAAVKLVTHLASVPSTAAQFRTVLLDMPAEARQQLQVRHIFVLQLFPSYARLLTLLSLENKLG